MKEIEVLVRIVKGDTNYIVSTLKTLCNSLGKEKVYDIYYYDPLRKNLQPNKDLELQEAFRIRKKGEKCFITYKVDNFDIDGKWLYSDENETIVGNYDELVKIINRLGYKKLVIVDMVKHFFENEFFRISYEKVKNLGDFIEVELKKMKSNNIREERNRIIEFINSLEIEVSNDVGIGKPGLLLKENGILEK